MAYIQPGSTLSLTAPRDVTPGVGVLVGALFAVALGTYAEDAVGEFSTEGVHEIAKTSAQAWTEGAAIYWDNTEFKATTDSAAGRLIGVATEAAANPSSTGRVKLLGNASATAEGPQAAIASLTFGTNITAATANDALTDSSATNPTEAQFNELAKELGTKVNAILTALRSAGIIASS
jgi:predicted RecA/RadA family phage recombinase